MMPKSPASSQASRSSKGVAAPMRRFGAPDVSFTIPCCFPTDVREVPRPEVAPRCDKVAEHGILPQLEQVARSRERHIDNGLRPPRIKAAGIKAAGIEPQ